MAVKTAEESNLNITLRNEEAHDEEIVISLPMICKKLKKYFLPWLLISVIIGGVISGVSIFHSTTSNTPVVALISFTYHGIEKGKMPDGTDFDAYELINPQVLEAALKSCNMDVSMLEIVRQSIVIEGKTPPDAIDRLTAYKSIFDSGNNQIAAAEKLLASKWYPTQFEITFEYRDISLSRDDAVRLINEILAEYRNFFFKKYGYNNPLGNALNSVDYAEYDYSAAVDVFNSTLNSLKGYVNNLSSSDSTRFRSSVTGYTFSDIRESIKSVQNIDLSLIDSYLRVNNIAKDKDQLQAYYEYRIEMENRALKSYEENLVAIKEAVENYKKDQINVFTNGSINTESTVASEEYDKLINRQLSMQSNVTEAKQSIAYYNDRLAALHRSLSAGSGKVERVEKDLEAIDKKVKTLIKVVEDTANDYYQNVSLANAYTILVPANSEVSASIKTGIKNVIYPLIGIELVLFMAYLALAFIEAIRTDYLRRTAAKAEAGDDAAAAGGDGNDDAPDVTEAPKAKDEPKDKKRSK